MDKAIKPMKCPVCEKLNCKSKGVNHRRPNFYRNNKFYLVRCYICDKNEGRENWAVFVATGKCAWCGCDESTDRIICDRNKIKRKTKKIRHRFEALEI